MSSNPLSKTAVKQKVGERKLSWIDWVGAAVWLIGIAVIGLLLVTEDAPGRAMFYFSLLWVYMFICAGVISVIVRPWATKNHPQAYVKYACSNCAKIVPANVTDCPKCKSEFVPE